MALGIIDENDILQALEDQDKWKWRYFRRLWRRQWHWRQLNNPYPIREENLGDILSIKNPVKETKKRSKLNKSNISEIYNDSIKLKK